MINIADGDARKMLTLLSELPDLLRDYAADQSYHRDGAKYVRDRTMAQYHDRHREQALTLAETVDQLAATLTRKTRAQLRAVG